MKMTPENDDFSEEEAVEDEGGEPPKKKHTILLVIAAIVVIAAVIGVLIANHIICLDHEYAAATCTEPETCIYCGRTRGEALGHKWIEATCTEPKICSVCGGTEGDPLGHDWIEATCTEPQTCARCGVTEGDPLGHDYVDGNCIRCDAYDPDNPAIGTYTGFGVLSNGAGILCGSDTVQYSLDLKPEGEGYITFGQDGYACTWKQTGSDTYTIEGSDVSCDLEYSDGGAMTLSLTNEKGESVDIIFAQDNAVQAAGSPAGSYVCTACRDVDGPAYDTPEDTLVLLPGGIGCYHTTDSDTENDYLISWSFSGTQITLDLPGEDEVSVSEDSADGVLTVTVGRYVYDFTKS